MHISKVKIKNFKCFRNTFILELNAGINILVGNNEAGKSTILEAIHLALSGLFHGRYLKNEISEYLFNNDCVKEYKEGLKSGKYMDAPEIIIEIFIAGDDLPLFEGDGNSENRNECGICLKIALDDKYKVEYAEFVNSGEVTSLPIEFYEVTWTTCAREPITPKRIPIKSALIDSSSNRYQNGSDIYISHIIKNHLEERDRNELSQAHRKLQFVFNEDEAVLKVNNLIKGISKKGEKDRAVRLAIDLSARNAWENSFLTYVEEVPFHHIGKGEQAVIKTKIALEHRKAKEANVILIEEPENHLSHSKLNQLVKDIQEKCLEKQILISTHSSFVANKLGLDNLILLDNKRTLKLNELESATRRFFSKIPGYDTLRLLLCKKAILVEGDSDELIVQKAYMQKNGCLPIEDEIDVISVGTSFLRFLEIAAKIGKRVSVVTDNDGNVTGLRKKYENYLSPNLKPGIKICFDEIEDKAHLAIPNYNYNTLEPKFIKANGVSRVNQILGKELGEEQLHIYMKENKTEVALKIFEIKQSVVFPPYILSAIED